MANVAPSNLEPLLENKTFVQVSTVPASVPFSDSKLGVKRMPTSDLERSQATSSALVGQETADNPEVLDDIALGKWPTFNDETARKNLLAYKKWMLTSKWIFDRKRVEEAFYIIEEDIPISWGPNGEVEDLVCGPALPYCYYCNALTWISFFIIYAIARLGVKRDHVGMALFPSGSCLAAIGAVFLSFTFLTLGLEFMGAMYVLPSQAIAAGESLWNEKKANWASKRTFNQWAVGMLTLSFFYHLDICTTAIFIARIVKSCEDCQELNHLWRDSMEKSFLSKIPFISFMLSVQFQQLVEGGMLVMVLQLLYALAFSYPTSPNLSVDNNAKNNMSESKKNEYAWCDYKLASLLPNEILNHPESLKGKMVGDEGDWTTRPQGQDNSTGDKMLLCDGDLIPVPETEEDDETKFARVKYHLDNVQSMNGFVDTYEMRLARHRRARVAVFDSFFKNNMGYGRAVQALVESGRMNMMQWHDDAYLSQAEHAWSPWTMVNEIRRTNFRFFLFALQAAFIPNFQVTFLGIVASNQNADQAGTSSGTSSSNAQTAVSTIICTIMGLKYLLYEVQAVNKHEAMAWIAIESHNRRAEQFKCQRRRWEGTRLSRRAVISRIFNCALLIIFSVLYLYLIVKVTMVMVVCPSDKRMYNVQWPPFSLKGCQIVRNSTMCTCKLNEAMDDYTCYNNQTA